MNKDEIAEYLKDKEFDFARANAALLICDLAFGAYVNGQKTIGTFFSPNFVYIWKDKLSAFHQIIAKEIIVEAEKHLYSEYKRDPATLDAKMEESLALERQIDDLWSTYDPVEPLSIFEKLIELSNRWWPYAAIEENKGAIINEDVIPRFAKRHGLDLREATEIFVNMSHPETPTALNDEHRLFLEICLKIGNKKDPTKLIERYLREFFWMSSNFYRPVHLTDELLKSRADRELAKKGILEIEKELTGLKNSFENIHVQKLDIISRYSFTEEDIADIKFAEKVILWVDRRKIGMMKDFYYILSILEDVSLKNNIDYDDLSFYTIDELSALLQGGDKVDSAEIGKRAAGVFITWEKGRPCQMLYGGEAKSLFEFATRYSHQGDIKGFVASTGGKKSVSGRARIVVRPEHEQFEDGEILVTSMTRVEFLPLMRKAKAIITDEGGIACHAAIVSRELGIPAIIGTKVGTKLLKSGDIVEMDLEGGIVKISG